MENLYMEVLKALQEENKEQAVMLATKALEAGTVTVPELYEKILVPGLASLQEEYPEDDALIWREHVRSGIVRTIIEMAYPYVLKQRKAAAASKGKVIILCPEFEDHELGAKMVADFFTMEGYDATFIGARTTEQTLFKAVEIIKPDYISISVTNYYNLVSVKKLIADIKTKYSDTCAFIVGGNAFAANLDAYKSVGADILLRNYEEIKNLSKEGV